MRVIYHPGVSFVNTPDQLAPRDRITDSAPMSAQHTFDALAEPINAVSCWTVAECQKEHWPGQPPERLDDDLDAHFFVGSAGIKQNGYIVREIPTGEGRQRSPRGACRHFR